MRLDQALERYLVALEADGVASKTIRWYRSMLHTSSHGCLAWLISRGHQDVRQVTTTDLRLYVVWLRSSTNLKTRDELSQHTIDSYIRAMHGFWNWLAAEMAIPDPTNRIAFPKARDLAPKPIAIDDLRKMFDACGDDEIGIRDRAMMAFMLDTGARAAGVCGLTTSALDLDARKAIVTEKGRRTRHVVFSAATGDLLKDWLEKRRHKQVSHVFYNMHTGAALQPDGLRLALRYLARRAGVTGRVNPHSFRHAFAREYILAGGDLATLSRLLGHRQVSTTVGYYTLFTNDEIASMHEKYSPMNRLKDKDDELPE